MKRSAAGNVDYVLNGAAHGDLADMLINCGGDFGAMRPYIDDDGYSYITVNEGTDHEQVLEANSQATLRKDEWIQFDTAIIKATQSRLRAVADLRKAGLVYNLPNGMSKTVLQHQMISDIGPAIVSMDALRESENDRIVYELENLPLPIISKDFSFSARQLMASKNDGPGLDTTQAELCGRKIAEEAEKMLLGLSTIASLYTYGGGTIYGYTNFPYRVTYTITSPIAGGWTPADFVDDVLGMMQASINNLQFGPWVLYVGTSWQRFMGSDFSAAKGDQTLRDRLLRIENLTDVRQLDFLTGYQVLLVQMTSETVREVIGMDVTTIQYDTRGGLQKNWKVMAMMVPQLRTDITHSCGIVHGSP